MSGGVFLLDFFETKNLRGGLDHRVYKYPKIHKREEEKIHDKSDHAWV